MRNYRDLLVWERAHNLTLCIYTATQAFPKEERFGITSQVRRAASSIAANLAEGCGRRSDREMARFVQIAMGSAGEVSYHLLLCRDLGLLKAEEFNRLGSATEEIMRMLSALAARLKSSGSRGALDPTAKG